MSNHLKNNNFSSLAVFVAVFNNFCSYFRGSMFNLANHLRELIAKDTVVPPMDIDTSTLTGIHHKNHTPPAVFRPFTAREGKFQTLKIHLFLS